MRIFRFCNPLWGGLQNYFLCYRYFLVTFRIRMLWYKDQKWPFTVVKSSLIRNTRKCTVELVHFTLETLLKNTCNTEKIILNTSSQRAAKLKYSHNFSLIFKVGLSLCKKICFICFNESSLKVVKNAFYFILKKALFVLKIFKFLS